ncbi:MAG: MlaA family lipoprotein [Nitrospiraceae bacterium]
MDQGAGGIVRLIIGVLLVVGVVSCASGPEQTSGVASLSPASTLQNVSGELVPEFPLLASARTDGAGAAFAQTSQKEPVKDQKRQGKPLQKPAPKREGSDEVEEEPYDPFQTEEDRLAARAEEYDPWEPFNAAMFEFNRKVDKYVLKPVATAYDAVLPDELERGLRNFFHNARFVPRFMNNLFQGKLKGAGLEMGRFVINSTLGVAGFLDFAKEVFGMETPDEDLGQTLGWYGVNPGPYLVLPLLQPFTLRDAIGYAGDIFLDPINYLVFPSIELDGAPSLIDHNDRDTTTILQFGTRGLEIVNERALNLETFQGVEEATVDLYGAVRNAYLQRRARQIRE